MGIPEELKSVEETEWAKLLWPFLASLFTLLSLGLLLEIALRFFNAGDNFFNLWEIIGGLIVGGTVAKIGRTLTSRSLSLIGVKEEYQHLWKVALALLLLVAALCFRAFGVPVIARSYNNAGVELQNGYDETGKPVRGGKKLTSAIHNFRRSISLNPEYVEAHYNLAQAYEDMFDYERAIAEYQQAIGNNDRHLFSYNNLARLHIIHNKDHSRALKLLEKAYELSEDENVIKAIKISIDGKEIDADSKRKRFQYSIYKNLGWAYFGLGAYREAQHNLDQAITLDPEGPAPYCLLAMTLEEQKLSTEAKARWKECAEKRGARSDEIEPEWRGKLMERTYAGAVK